MFEKMRENIRVSHTKKKSKAKRIKSQRVQIRALFEDSG